MVGWQPSGFSASEIHAVVGVHASNDALGTQFPEETVCIMHHPISTASYPARVLNAP